MTTDLLRKPSLGKAEENFAASTLTEKFTHNLRTHFYTVALYAGKSKTMDLADVTEQVMAKIRDRASAQSLADSVQLTADGQTLSRKGIFFMQAPARFADEVRMIDGIGSVEMPIKRGAQRPRR